MSNFTWQHIDFEDGGNPYICMTEKAFNRIEKKYNLEKVGKNLWIAKDKQEGSEDLFKFKDFID